MIVKITHARISDGFKTVARTNCAVVGKTPFHHITIPAGLHFGYENGFIVFRINRHAFEIAHIFAVVNNCLSDFSGRKNANAGRGINRIGRGLKHIFLKLPIAVRSARAVWIFNI